MVARAAGSNRLVRCIIYIAYNLANGDDKRLRVDVGIAGPQFRRRPSRRRPAKRISTFRGTVSGGNDFPLPVRRRKSAAGQHPVTSDPPPTLPFLVLYSCVCVQLSPCTPERLSKSEILISKRIRWIWTRIIDDVQSAYYYVCIMDGDCNRYRDQTICSYFVFKITNCKYNILYN